ncbi:hypothetical protein KKF84_18695, partial [Myxococcota bacterium]|nr:hypothetical protein [Myxococcota bacterium]
MKPLIIALVLSLVPLCTQAQQFDEPLASLNPSETLVLRLLPYAQEVQVDVEYGHGRSLTTQAREALALAPSWIRPALFDTLSRLDLVNQAAISELITLAYAEDPRYVDEVAFSIAHLPMEDLLYDNPTFHTSFDPELLMENVRGIYAAGEFIHFASLVERLEGTDQAYTTVLLTMADGEWEVPRDMYYWYVVHPRLADDSALYIDPRTGNPSPRDERGVFWRTMVWAEDPDPDYTFPSTLKAPSAVDNLSDYTADGGLEIPGADAVIEVAGPGGEPLMLHYARGRGMVYATTLPVENSSGPLMENLVSAGFGHGSVLAPYLGEPVLLLKERNPFMDNVVEEYLQAEGFDFTVLDSTGITALSGEADLAGFKKIIIAGDQPLSLYLALEAQADIFEAWLDTYASKVLLFLGAMDSGHEADDWSQTTLPLGFTRVNQGNLLTGTPRGYPTFRQVITLGASAPGNYVWDGAAHANLSGQRFFSDQDMVLDRLGYLVSQTLELNVSEIPAEYRGPDGDCPSCSVVRSPYPQRIIYQHYGNCGELQDTGM